MAISMPTIAAVVEAGGVGEDGAGNELPREDGSGGGEVAEVGEEHHHLHSTERAPQAHGECPTCSDRNQTRGTSATSDEGRGTHRATGGHQRGEHGGGGGLHSPPSRRGSVVACWGAPAVSISGAWFAWTSVAVKVLGSTRPK